MKRPARQVKDIQSTSSLRLTLFLLCLLGMPSDAYANAGVPMIFLTYPAMLIALLPVILLEAVVFQRRLQLGYRGVAWNVGVPIDREDVVVPGEVPIVVVGVGRVDAGERRN
ncbi:MAG: hypothetical protein HYT88_03480, partial [Candidatus Omnitrophica bacterium]|nr:hypothetical protein [Candidatus Omnitrophota bacterium]